MPFCSFSKDFAESAFTSVENKFITKYLPEADGDAVRVYLYGLYLCASAQEFDAENAARLLRITPARLADIFGFWEECGLVNVLSRSPLLVEYLPVSAAVGKPKPLRPEKYAEFNRELFSILQRAEKFLKPYEHQKILEFLENNPMQPQAFLLVVEYCAKKDGNKLTLQHILHAAQKLVANHLYTYEQVEAEYADFNANTNLLGELFARLGLFRKPREDDAALLTKWQRLGLEREVILVAADSLPRGSMQSLDTLLCELAEKDVKEAKQAKEYLERRSELIRLVYQIARSLNVKVDQPVHFLETYLEGWVERGYDGESLPPLAVLAGRLGYGFAEMDGLLGELYARGIVDAESVTEYCREQNARLKLIQNIEKICGVVKKTQGALEMAATWKAWNFSDAMILEAAKRSANASSPLAYINRLLSEWKRLGVFTLSEIPERETAPTAVRQTFKSEAAVAADARSERERYYSELRRRAIDRAEAAEQRARADSEYAAAEQEIKKGEIEAAKAEIFSPDALPEIQARLKFAREKRAAALLRLNIKEEDLVPAFTCKKCSDTGFLPDGRACDCYRG